MPRECVRHVIGRSRTRSGGFAFAKIMCIFRVLRDTRDGFRRDGSNKGTADAAAGKSSDCSVPPRSVTESSAPGVDFSWCYRQRIASERATMEIGIKWFRLQINWPEHPAENLAFFEALLKNGRFWLFICSLAPAESPSACSQSLLARSASRRRQSQHATEI